MLSAKFDLTQLATKLAKDYETGTQMACDSNKLCGTRNL
jgi:hypothetical protein